MESDNHSFLNKNFDASKISRVEHRTEDEVWSYETFFDSDGNKLLYREQENIPDYKYNYLKEEYFNSSGERVRSFMIDVLECCDPQFLVISIASGPQTLAAAGSERGKIEDRHPGQRIVKNYL